MSRERNGGEVRVGGMGPRRAPGAAAVPEPPEASFWLERTPLPTARRPGTAPAAPAAGRGRSALAPPGTVCPKCDSPLSPSEPACPSCGLKRAMFNRYRAGHGDRAPASLDKLWRHLEARWSDPELHEQFLAQVSVCGAYAYAASRYRRAARERQSDAIAKLQLERLSRMVHAVMAVSSVRHGRERAAHPYRALAIIVVLLALGGVTSLYMFRRHSAQAQESIDRVPPSIMVKRGHNVDTDGKAARPFGGLRAHGARGGAQLRRRGAADEARGDEARGDDARGDDGRSDEAGADQRPDGRSDEARADQARPDEAQAESGETTGPDGEPAAGSE